MAWMVLALDGDDEAAPARRAAARDSHVAWITAEAAAGRLALGLPVHDEQGRSLGSLMLLDTDRAGLDAYLAAEPFATTGVWRRIATHPFRIAPLPYAAWPAPDSPAPPRRSHTIVIAMDGTDAEAMRRRLTARPAHMTRVAPLAADGTLLFGGAILDAPDGRMIGSVAVTRHADHAAAKAFWDADPYVTSDVWRQVTLYGTQFRALPYKPLPR